MTVELLLPLLAMHMSACLHVPKLASEVSFMWVEIVFPGLCSSSACEQCHVLTLKVLVTTIDALGRFETG